MLFSLLTQLAFNAMRVKPNKKLAVPFSNWSITRGDVVMIRAGQDKKKIGRVMRVWRKANKVTVHKINMRTMVSSMQIHEYRR